MVGLGCAGAPDDCVGDSAAAFVCGGDVALEIGTGEASFEPLEDGVLPLHRGAQGLQHVLLSLRADIDSGAVGRATVGLSAWDGRASVVDPIEVGLAIVDDGGLALVPGALLVLPDPDAVIGRTLGFAASMAPVGGDGEARGFVTARVEWADDAGSARVAPEVAEALPAAYLAPGGRR